MTYCCAIFSRGAKTLEEAQGTSASSCARKLGSPAGERLLDVGCGWGSFAVHAAGTRRPRHRHHAARAPG